MGNDVDNMALWDQVCVTPFEITKKVEQRGGFTAICAQAQLKRATELWGPYGANWGVKNLTYLTIKDKAGQVVELCLDADFFYPGGEFQLGADIKYRAGNDSRKKLLTDLTTKALSKLGFNSDVFEGKYDDNKYLAGLKAKPTATAADYTPVMDKCKTLDALAKCWQDNSTDWLQSLSGPEKGKLTGYKDDLKKILAGAG